MSGQERTAAACYKTHKTMHNMHRFTPSSAQYPAKCKRSIIWQTEWIGVLCRGYSQVWCISTSRQILQDCTTHTDPGNMFHLLLGNLVVVQLRLKKTWETFVNVFKMPEVWVNKSTTYKGRYVNRQNLVNSVQPQEEFAEERSFSHLVKESRK